MFMLLNLTRTFASHHKPTPTIPPDILVSLPSCARDTFNSLAKGRPINQYMAEGIGIINGSSRDFGEGIAAAAQLVLVHLEPGRFQ
jgi:hypothetical protein